MRKRVVISGIGVIASNGIGKDAFWQALMRGDSGIREISLFDTADFRVHKAGEITDFNPCEFLGEKGLRTLDRSTKLAASAARLALSDGQLVIDEDNAYSTGVALGCTMGSLNSICEFDKVTISEGPQFVNPAFFPNTVFNSPASQVSIKCNIKGFNATISTGFTASLEAIRYAWDCIDTGKADMALAGGVEELCLPTFLGFYKSGCLAGSKDGGLECSCPFDKRRNGIMLGEGSAIFLIEDLESALARKARVYAEILGFGRGFDAYGINTYNPTGSGLRSAVDAALSEARIPPSRIDYICAAANSSLEADRIETAVIKQVFTDKESMPCVSSIKSMTGECFSAGGALQTAAAACALANNTVPPTINYEAEDPDCDLDYVVNEPRRQRLDTVLINAMGPTSFNASLIISRYTC